MAAETSSESDSSSVPADSCGAEVPDSVHRWNFWISGSEAAVYVGAINMMGPMTLIPFLFRETGIHDSWLGLFTISALIAALGSPIGTAMAAGRTRKLPFCIKVGAFQRLPYALVPLGVMFFFSRPQILLALLVAAWMLSGFFGGIAWPIFNVVITSGVRESWWGRLMSIRNFLSALAGLLATVFVWAVNRVAAVPHNYTVLGWLSLAFLFVSLFVCSRLREVPMPIQHARPPEGLRNVLHTMRSIYREDARMPWLVLCYVVRSFGFLLGTYMTAVFVERCNLDESHMWIPVILLSLPQLPAHLLSGWLVDRYGAKLALVLSALLVCVNSLQIIFCHNLLTFTILFSYIAVGGSLIQIAWPTLLVKLAPVAKRPAYISTLSLSTAPGAVLTSCFGILLVRWTGYDYVFYVSATGGLIAALLFAFTLPNIRQAPQE